MACAGDPARESGGLATDNERCSAHAAAPGFARYPDAASRTFASPRRSAPGAIRRVREHVEAHLSESMDLAELAAIAGLSVYHFARAFKQTAGVPPHHYLVHRRIERAQEMLARSELPLSEIALAVGFSDQSHLARHFRQTLGVTPGQFRWSLR